MNLLLLIVGFFLLVALALYVIGVIVERRERRLTLQITPEAARPVIDFRPEKPLPRVVGVYNRPTVH